MAGNYRYEVAPTGVGWCWQVWVNEDGWSGDYFVVFGSRDRAVRKAMRHIARAQARAERRRRLTVKGQG